MSVEVKEEKPTVEEKPEPEVVDLGEDEEDEEDLEEDEDEEEDDEDLDDMSEDEVDLGEILINALETPDGETVCTALLGIRDHMETQNKILLKILKTLS